MIEIRGRTTSAVCAAALALSIALPPASAHAGTRRVWMDAFRPGMVTSLGGDAFVQSPGKIESAAFLAGSTVWFGVTPVKLPVGARIKAASYFHRGTGGETAMVLFRARPGELEQELMVGISSASTVLVSEVAMSPNPLADLVVRPGYRYYLWVRLDTGTSVHGAVVRFR